jgi:hypothetical protein
MHARFFNTDADYDHNSEVYRVVNIERHQVKSATDRKDGQIEVLSCFVHCTKWTTETGNNNCIGYSIKKIYTKRLNTRSHTMTPLQYVIVNV